MNPPPHNPNPPDDEAQAPDEPAPELDNAVLDDGSGPEASEEPAGPRLAEVEELAAGDEPSEDDDPVEPRLVALIEALLFAAGRVTTLDELADASDETPERVEAALARLSDQLAGRGVQVLQLAGGYRLSTRPEYADAVRHLLQPPPLRLSPARLETLAVIAYHQPVTRAEIEAVRGVDSQATLRSLLELELIELRGRREDKPGRPLEYGTSKRFLETFGLAQMGDLPRLEELDSWSAG